jgi:serine/threonine-protein kinase
VSEGLAASLGSRIAWGAFATVVLVAVLTPGIYPLLNKSSSDQAAPQPSSSAQNAGEAGGNTPRAMPVERPISDPKDRISQINQFVNAYEGGECFFATPISVSEHNATLEGYGSAVAPFETLSDRFKRNIGFEPFIRAHRVAPAQCGAVSFLSRMRNQRGPVPHLELGTVTLRDGETLTGTITDFANRDIALLLVADDGSVRDLSNELTTTGNTKSFNIQIQKSDSEPAQPNLILALAESKPLDALRHSELGKADQVFAQLLAEALRDGQTVSVSAKFFAVEK